LLMRQYEGARVDEARQGALIQVVEPAIPPDKPTSLYRLWIALAGLFCALPLALAAVVVAEVIAILRRERRRTGSWITALEESAHGAWQ